jgi:catechol 2,3-dioxygenase-like lactoylglutathione lyase family enzyme
MTQALPMAPAVRFHLSLNVADLNQSVAFYKVLFGTEPAKCRPDYAKFELEDPPLVLSLEPVGRAPGGALNHAGFRLPDAPALVAVQRRLEAAGIRTQRQEGVECCYARQTKFWVADPDQTLWEIYVLEEDIDHRGAGQTREEMLPARQSANGSAGIGEPTWEHRLGDPVPERIPLADGSAGEVMLRGTFNAALDEKDRTHLLKEAARVLRPGGRVVVHVLVADRPFPGAFPGLPAPADRVRRVPAESEPQEALEAAGFGRLDLLKFGAAPCFQLGNVEMREMLLAGSKPAAGGPEGKRVVLYKGPLRSVTDDAGNELPRGRRVAVSATAWEQLRQGPLAERFVFFPEGRAPRA